MKDVPFSDFVGLSFVQKLASARRVLTPTAPSPAPNIPATLPNEEIEAVEGVLRYEVDQVLDETDAPDDDTGLLNTGWTSQYLLKSRKFRLDPTETKRYHNSLRQQLEQLRYRFRVQEPFYLAMEVPVNMDLLSFDRLRTAPLCFTERSQDTILIQSVLDIFPLCRQCKSDDRTAFRSFFPMAVECLARLITRSCTDFEGIVKVLCTTKLLGEVDAEHAETLNLNITSKRDITVSNPAEGALRANEQSPAFALWLSRDFTTLVSFAADWNRRYNRARQVHERCLGEGSWGDATLICESMELWLEAGGVYGYREEMLRENC
ncbi:hypothetical protein MMC21_007576 [Puttea exsequens]|nr:hypothetical protein [Puttea exsequens]